MQIHPFTLRKALYFILINKVQRDHKSANLAILQGLSVCKIKYEPKRCIVKDLSDSMRLEEILF